MDLGLFKIRGFGLFTIRGLADLGLFKIKGVICLLSMLGSLYAILYRYYVLYFENVLIKKITSMTIKCRSCQPKK